jgi:hypothetical protein
LHGVAELKGRPTFMRVSLRARAEGRETAMMEDAGPSSGVVYVKFVEVGGLARPMLESAADSNEPRSAA